MAIIGAISRHITVLVVAVTALALLQPEWFGWMDTSAITPMLGVIMFGMGLTLKPSDFHPVLTHPKELLIGEVAQFVIMPSVAWLLCRLLKLPQELALGVILVGCCPGGTASNVMCYLAKGDIALSVAMTSFSTLLAPVVTPALVLLLADRSVDVNAWGMLLSIVQIVIMPIVAGLFVGSYCKRVSQVFLPYLPAFSTLSVASIIAIVVSHNAQNIISCSIVVGVSVVLHNLCGLLIGYLAAWTAGLPKDKRTSICIEVGMQNSGLATSLATTQFAMYPMAAVPGALFSVWHNFSGSIAAHVLRSGMLRRH